MIPPPEKHHSTKQAGITQALGSNLTAYWLAMLSEPQLSQLQRGSPFPSLGPGGG